MPSDTHQRVTVRRPTSIRISQWVIAGLVANCMMAANDLFSQIVTHVTEENFSKSPHWEEFHNRLLPDKLPQVTQAFGYRTSHFAGGERAGEIGGTIHRTMTPASYAQTIPAMSLTEPILASGRLAVTRADSSSGVMFGWFHESSRGWRTPNALGLRIDGNGGKYWLFFEYGTRNWKTGGGGAFEGERYQTTPTKPFAADGTSHAWSLRYDPHGPDQDGTLSFIVDDRRYEIKVPADHKADGATWNRFGFWNVQVGGGSMDVFMDDLKLGDQQIGFDDDPGWIGAGNRITFDERVIRPMHDFGFSATSHAGDQKGELGGIIFRDEQPAYFADPVGPLTLDHELTASGRLVLRSAGSDSGVHFGWFNGAAKQNKTTPEHKTPQTDYIAVMVEGPSRVGHYFRASYRTSSGNGQAPTEDPLTSTPRPLIRPDSQQHRWSLKYRPQVAGGRGQMTVELDGTSHTLDLAPGHRGEGAVLDRFGIFNIQSGGHHVELFLDDLQYSKATRAASEPIAVKPSEPQLFVDDYVIQSHDGVHRTLRQPVKDDHGARPILSLGDLHIHVPGTLEANGSILYDQRLKKYVLLALALRTPWDGWDKTQLYRFTSPDGINWTVGDSGSPQPVFPLSREDLRDAESGLYATNIDLCSFVYDARDQQAPYKGWIWFANMGELEGLYYVSSPDGIHWKRGPLVTGIHDFAIKQDGWELFGSGDVTIVSHDPLSGHYLAQIKLANKVAVGPENRQRSRAFQFVDRLDQRIDPSRLNRVDLVPPVAARDGDLPWDEYYASTAWRYGSLWLGGLKVWHGGGDYSYSAAGSAFIKLMYSRDGLDWHKVPYLNDEYTQAVWIANGSEGGNGGQNDGGYITEFSQGPVRIGDELIYYYGSSSWGKNHPRGVRVSGGGIFRARLRPDGFVSVDAGRLTTKPVLFEGENLFVNGIGPISVVVLCGGQPVGSARMEGDSLRHEVIFDGQPLRALVGQAPVELQFEIEPGGQLFSFTTR